MNDVLESLNNFRLTPHFNLQEFEDKDAKVVRIDWRLVMKLECLRMSINKCIRISSGYRTRQTNERVSKNLNSVHLYGQAADCLIDDLEPNFVLARAKIIGIPVALYHDHNKSYHFALISSTEVTSLGV